MADGADPATRGDLRTRVFGTAQFQRLWIAQVVSALGDWLGFLAIVVLASRVGSDSPGAAIGLVMSARIIPGFLFSAGAGVLVDRWDRKRVMVTCSVIQAAVVCLLPFVGTVALLVAASLVLELCTLMWSPAKEASVPHLVPASHLTTANSLSLVAAYGTFPLAAALYSVLTAVAGGLAGFALADALNLDEVGLALYVDGATFALCALLVSTLDLPKPTRGVERSRAEAGDAGTADEAPTRAAAASVVRELRDGWHYVMIDPTVRAVNVGIATGLIGAAMLVPLGPVFATDVLGASDSGFGVLVFALGLGVAGGVCALSLLQERLPKAKTFTVAVFAAGGALLAGASMSTLPLAAVFVFVLGVCGGGVYVLGFTLLHERVADEIRGRVFAALYTLVRLCVLLAFALAPLLAELLGSLSDSAVDGELSVAGVTVGVPGVRLTLWLAGLIILGAGVLISTSLRQAAAGHVVGTVRSHADERPVEILEHTIEELAEDDWVAHHPDQEATG
jgi:dTMP kinase